MEKMKLVNFLKSTPWHVWHKRDRTPFLSYIFYKGSTEKMLKYFPYRITTHGSCAQYVITSEEQLENMRKHVWECIESNPSFILDFIGFFSKKHEEDLKKWKKFRLEFVVTLENEDILSAYSTYVDQLLSYGPVIYTPLCIDQMLENEALKCIKKYAPHEIVEKENIIMTPIRDSIIVEERRSLLNLALNKNSADFDILLTEHVEYFSFLKRKGMFLEFFDESYYRDQINKISNPNIELSKLNDDRKKRKEIFDQFLVGIESIRDQTILRTVNESIFFRSWRTERIEQSSFYAFPLIKELARRIGLSNELDVLYLYPDEISKLLKGVGDDVSEQIKRRKEGYVFMIQDDSVEICEDGSNLTELVSTFIEDTHDLVSVHGNISYPGRVKGYAVVVQNRQDYEKINRDDILVTPSTIPEMVPYLKNVKAIITEEGGILSHGALISRELQIPCIIGTKVATKVFKDGDLVEVDAEKGIVKKIS
ncbi:MAG: hypothetical protein HYV41_05290 [Candidatus Magasanikbacteria bacterium]|nr:hypothetical protein [Candidatus Magasanikbacteria bacterium]